MPRQWYSDRDRCTPSLLIDKGYAGKGDSGRGITGEKEQAAAAPATVRIIQAVGTRR